MRISEIRNTQLFQDLCQQLLVAEHPDTQIVNDSSGDEGMDGYVASTHTLYAVYCPEVSPTPKRYYQRKITSDLRKAVNLRDDLGYQIDHWVFLTPAPLEEELHRYIFDKAAAAGFLTGANQSEMHLVNLLTRHKNLRSQFPQLIISDIETDLREVREGVHGLGSQIGSQGSDITDKLNLVLEKIVNQDKSAQRLQERAEQEYTKRFERAKDLSERGLYITAKRAFGEIVSDLKREPEFSSPTFLSRAYNGWALCEWKLDNIDEAARLFKESYTYTPDDPSRISNLAVAQMLRGDTSAALKTIERSLAMAPDDEFSVKRKANILAKAKRFQETFDYLEGKNQPALRSLFEGLKCVEEGRSDEAERAFREALSHQPDDVDFMHFAAESILTNHGDVISRENILPWKLPEAIIRGLREAEELLSRVIEIHQTQELPKKLTCALVDRAGARLRLGDYDGTIRDCAEALRIDPDNTIALWNKARAEMLVPDYGAATKSWERYVELAEDDENGVKSLINAYFLIGDITRAKPLVLRELERDGTEQRANFLDTAVVILDRNLDYDLAESLIARIENQSPGSALALMLRATHLQTTGKEGVEDLLRQALESADGAVRPLVVSKLANILYEESRFKEALPLYEELTDDREKNPISIRRLICLCNSNRMKEALDYAARLKGDVEIDAEITPVEAFIHRSFGNFETAAKLYLNLYHKTGDIAYLVEHGKRLYRLGEPQAAVRAFDQVRNRVTGTEDLFHLARGYNAVGQAGVAMELAYKALHQDLDNPQVHLAYIKLFLDTRNHRDQVDEKYKETFRDVGNKFNGRFPDAEGFESINVKENPNYVFEMLEQRETSVSAILDDYKNNRLAISSERFLHGRTMFDVWQALTSMQEPGFKGSLAIHEEQQRERETVARCERVVVDLLALFTLQKINKLSLLTELFEAVLVHQAALDELNETIQEEALHAESGRSYAATVRGRFVMKDVPAEVIRENLELLEAVRGFVRKTSMLSGLQKELSDLDREVIESLGYSASYTCILAAQTGLPLLTDDGLLRVALRNTYGVESFSTHTLLAQAMESGKLAEEEFYEAVLLLLKLRYRYVPASAALLTHSAVKNGFESGDDFLTVLEEMGRGEVSIPWLANIAGDFLKDLWLRSLVDTTKSLLLHAVLAAVTEHHPPQAALRTLLAYLHSQMRLVPHYYMDIYGQTKRWAAVTYPEVSL